MNCSIYIFGEFGSGYTQYPNDYAVEVFRDFYNRATAESQVTIHRENNLMYYGYIRKLDINSQYIGFCILFNGVMYSDIHGLFRLFENAIADLVTNGIILQFDENGDIISKVNSLFEKRTEVERISSIIINGVQSIGESLKKLPPVSYGISDSEIKKFSVEDNNEDIVDASAKYAYTYITKGKDYDNATLSSYRGVLKRLYTEKTELSKEYSSLRKEYNELKKQKKQFRNVIILILVAFALILGLLALNGSLNNTRIELSNTIDELNETKETLSQTKNKLSNSHKELSKFKNKVSELNVQIGEKDEEISNMRDSLDLVAEKIDEMEQNLSMFYQLMPIVINSVSIGNVYKGGSLETSYGNTIHSENTMYLKPRITYYGLSGLSSNRDITLDVKLYTPSGLSTGTSSPSGCSYKQNIHINSGENTIKLEGWGGEKKGHWAKGTYRFEFWYNNVCLKAKTFTIY